MGLYEDLFAFASKTSPEINQQAQSRRTLCELPESTQQEL